MHQTLTGEITHPRLSAEGVTPSPPERKANAQGIVRNNGLISRRLRLANNVDVGRGASVPTAMAVAPPTMKGRGGGPLLLTADSAFKLRVHDAATLATTRTVLGPTYGGSLCTLHVFQPHGASQPYLAYATRQKVHLLIASLNILSSSQRLCTPVLCQVFHMEALSTVLTRSKIRRVAFAHPVYGLTREALMLHLSIPCQVIGLSLLPPDGNPNKSMGLIAHPGAVSALAVSHDGRRLMSVGGSDSVINMWAVDAGALEVSAAMAAEAAGGASCYMQLLEGGEGGDFAAEVKDYFYYGQIHAQVRSFLSGHPRALEGVVTLAFRLSVVALSRRIDKRRTR